MSFMTKIVIPEGDLRYLEGFGCIIRTQFISLVEEDI